MLISTHNLTRYKVQAVDGGIGRCQDILFDDRMGGMRYMVASTAKWLPGRKVVVPPVYLEKPDQFGERIPVLLTKKEIEECPPLEEHQTVSRQYEIAYHQHYSLPFYWGNPEPPILTPAEAESVQADDVSDNHLQSAVEVIGYDVEGTDGDAGKVKDLLLDDQDWSIKFLIVDTGGLLSSHQVLISFNWLMEVRWPDRRVRFNLSEGAIESSLEYDPQNEVDLNHLIETHKAYDRPEYWTELK